MSRMQEEITKHSPHAYCGIDVGKDTLDVFIWPVGVQLRIANDKKAIKALACQLKQYDIRLIALEATSKYHRCAHTEDRK